MEKLDINIKSAMLWQLQHIVKNLTSAKFASVAQTETEKMFETKPYGEEYRKYLINFLFKGIEFQNSKQKETAKLNLLKPNLIKSMKSPNFLLKDIFVFMPEIKNLCDTYTDVLRHLGLKISEQLLFCLGIYVYCIHSEEAKSLKILKNKIREWFDYEKDGELPSYAVYTLLCILKSEHEFIEDTLFSQSIREYIIKQNPSGLKEDSIHAALDHSIFDCNRTNALYKFENDTKNVAEFKFVEKCANTYQVLEPWQVLIDLGPASSHFEYEVIVEVLRDFNKTSIRGLAHTLIILSNKFAQEDNRNNLEVITMKCNMKGDMTYINQDPNEYPKQIYEWNKENLTKALKEIYTSTAWIELIKFLDVDLDAREDLYFQSQQAFAIFIDLWMQLKPSQKQFPIEFLIANTWKNKKAQVICLDYAINYSYINQDIPFEKAKRRQDQVIQIQGIKPTAATYLRIWKCIDLVQTLVILSESPYYHRVRSLFDQPIRFIPEYLLLSLIKSKPKTGQIIVEDLYAHLLPSFLTGHTNSTPVLSEIWTINKELVINSMAELYKLNPKKMNLSRVLDISQSIKNSLLDIITNTKDYNFALQLGMLGAKRDFLHFENWIKMLIQNQGDPFVRCLLSYIKKNLFQPIEEQKDDKNIIEKALERSLLSEEKLCMIYENLHQLSEKDQTLLEYDTQKILSESFSKAVQLFPSIHTEQKNNDEIEEKANEYFQQLYKGEKEVDDLVKIMKDFRQSQNATEREIYACMVQNLFDEWKFFPKYPKKELCMTAKLFGKIISEKKIIDGVVTDIGLKCIVEGLKRDGKMFEFTITALEECKDSIEYEAGLMDILECKQLKDKKPDLYEYINKRYLDIKAASEESVPIEDTKLTNQPALNINIQNPLKQEIKEEKIMIMPGQFNARSPDPGMMMEGSFPAKLMRINKQPQANPALIGTPTAPGKYYNYNDPNKNQRLQNTPQQMYNQKDFYPQPTPSQPRSTRPFETSSLQTPPIDSMPSGLGSRALSRQSKDFKPKSLQMKNYLKKEDLMLPMEFSEILMTTLNMTGTDQIQKNAEKFEVHIKDEYIEPMAHQIVVSRVIESDEKRIEFFARFFHCMKNLKIVKTFITECIDAILKIIINESADSKMKNESAKLASPSVKNIATFLGYLTLVHNKPLFAEDIDLKQLFLEAHEKKCVGIAILVVCKILRTGEKSKIFNCNNPWMKGMYSLLLEYFNYFMKRPEIDKSCEKEIQLVLKVTTQIREQLRECTLFRDYENKITNNAELNYLLDRINVDPLIMSPKILEPAVETQEDQSQKIDPNLLLELSERDQISDIVKITETVRIFPNINQEFLKMLINSAIISAFREIREPVIRRVIPITLITTRVMILKDFALEPDAEKLRQASIYTAKSLSGMLAQITCKEPLKQQLARMLKDLILASDDAFIKSLSDEEKKNLIEVIRNENLEIGCQKVRLEIQREAIIGISREDGILEAIRLREVAKAQGEEYRDYSNISNFNKLPDLLKPSETGLTNDEFQVYQDFDTMSYFDIESQIIKDTEKLFDLEDEIKDECKPTDKTNKFIIDRFNKLLSAYFPSDTNYLDSVIIVKKELVELKSILTQIQNSQDILTEELLKQDKLIALNPAFLILLIEHKIISISLWQRRFAIYLKQSIEVVNSYEIIEFLETLVIYGVIDKGMISKEQIPDLLSCIEYYSKTKDNQAAIQWKCIVNLFEISDPVSQVFDELAIVYYDQWIKSKDIYSYYKKFLYKLGVVFKNTQNISMFFKFALERSLEIIENDPESDIVHDYTNLDKFIHLAILCSFNCAPHSSEKINNIIDEEQMLKIVWETLDEHHNERLVEFNQIPFKKIFMTFLKQYFKTFETAENSDNIDIFKKSNEVLMMFSNLFKKINPSTYPCFAFSWLELISSPYFLPFMLNNNRQERWFKLKELFIALFKFLKENIYENSENSPALEKFYEGTFKLCLVVLHDYPMFFCVHYFDLINNLPLYRTLNLRNSILAAYPKTLRLPDPASPITKFEVNASPFEQDRQTLLQYHTSESDYYSLKLELDNYLSTKSEENLRKICDKLEETQSIKNGRKIINTGVIHATILYLAYDIDSKKSIKELEDPANAIKFELMCKYLSTPVRDILLNSLFNELRLLNASTVYFMNIILNIFRNSDPSESLTNSQIARICVERCRSQKIFPWGLLAFHHRFKVEPKFVSMNIPESSSSSVNSSKSAAKEE